MDCSPPGSSVHGIFQARILEWVASSFFLQGSSWPRDWTHISCIGRNIFFITELPWKPKYFCIPLFLLFFISCITLPTLYFIFEIIFQINYLHPSHCFRLYSGGIQTQKAENVLFVTVFLIVSLFVCFFVCFWGGLNFLSLLKQYIESFPIFSSKRYVVRLSI